MKKIIIIGFLVALIAGLAIFFAGNTGERYSTDPNDANRSEERRVGKECL